MSKAKSVATVENNLPSVADRPSWMKDDSHRGNEGVTTQDMTIPRISIIQDLSPQGKKSKPEYIEGAEPKMAFNTVTQELYGESIFVVPVLFRKEYVVWKDIDHGGGFKGAFPTMSEAEEALSALEDAEKCEIVDTAQHFVLVLNKDSSMENPQYTEAVISMSKSQMKPSRQWNSMIQAAGGDRFERMYRLDVVDDKNAAGQEYYNWKPRQLGYVNEVLYKAAERLYDAVKGGAKDVARDAPTPEAPKHRQGKVEENEEF